MTAPRRDPAKPWGVKKSQPPVTEPPTLLSPPSTEPLRRAPLCRACGIWFPEKTGVFNISMGGGFLDRPGACRNVGNPGRSVPPFPPSRRLFRAFNGRRVPRPTRRLLEGWENRPPSPRFRNAPRLHAARMAAPEKPKEKGTLPDAPCCRRLNPPRNQSSLPRHQ